MKVYQVTIRRDGYEHDGYEYFFNKKEAEKRQKESNKFLWLDEEDAGTSVAFEPDKVVTYEFKMSKDGVLNLLNAVASHPNNG